MHRNLDITSRIYTQTYMHVYMMECVSKARIFVSALSIKPCVSILFEYKFNFNLLFNKKKLTSKKRYSKETILPNKRIKIMLCKQVPGLKPCAFIHLHQKITTKIHPGVGISCALAACQQISLPMLVT